VRFFRRLFPYLFLEWMGIYATRHSGMDAGIQSQGCEAMF